MLGNCVNLIEPVLLESKKERKESVVISQPFPSSPLPYVEMAMAVSSTSTKFNQSHRLAGFAQSSLFSNSIFNISFQQWFSHMRPYSKKLLSPSWNEVVDLISFTLCDRVRAINSSHFSCFSSLFLITFENWNVYLQNVNRKINQTAIMT